VRRELDRPTDKAGEARLALPAADRTDDVTPSLDDPREGAVGAGHLDELA
jgi:hypothetical protein